MALRDLLRGLAGEGTHVQRPDRTWWLLAPNPFVILADSAPATPTVVRHDPDSPPETRPLGLDPLGTMARALRGIRAEPVLARRQVDEFSEQPADGAAVWPFGLAVDALAGVGATVLTARRLRTPTRRLPAGQRIA